ncbi:MULTISPECIES: hypothetical protein [Clostridium]|uniref:hypothetical protein n=1 Tax=Clostridium TaxID=1485 RepID=UPI00082491AE|nr:MULTISPECIES: hypothetical protein [Clostridium]PJI10227.1 hypothetical protein CUB90_21150 [Clostridium sp. CT7]
MKNFIKKVITYLCYIFKGKKLEESIQDLKNINKEIISSNEELKTENKRLQDELLKIKNKSEEEKKELKEAQERIINENLDLRYFTNEVFPQILKGNKGFMDKKIAYDTFLKVVKRGSFKENKSEINKKQPSKIVVVK